jgi:4-hydroxy-3-methylbut-2-enyl diphosphate reductase
MTLIETVADAENVAPADTDRLAYLTQTTLSVDDTHDIVSTLERRFPNIVAPKGEDICYATSNRQAAVKAIAGRCQLVLVIGAPNSSNSLRLVEVAERCGTKSYLVQRAEDIDFDWFKGVETLGITAGASAPEVLVRQFISRISENFAVNEQQVVTAEESITFKLPRGLLDPVSA